MGSNCDVYLPPDVEPDKVARLAGILAGLKATQQDIGRGGDPTILTEVEGAGTKTCGISGMDAITLRAPDGLTLVDGETNHFASFHYCSRYNGRIYNKLYPTSNVFWCALSKRLVQWFGGVLIYNDCGYLKGKNVFRSKRHCPVDRHGLLSEDGPSWQKYQDALLKVKPLTMLDIEAANEVSGYKMERSVNA
jgi:hypothetical protein